ncbi:MAG: hypothetical protein GX139_12110 [Armatimonadetes bacterium]|nr:hypothetical protein [Armatimonadota bacterium]
MRCRRCGNEITHVPEHLASMAEWVCRQCTNLAPKREALQMSEETIQERQSFRGRRRAA